MRTALVIIGVLLLGGGAGLLPAAADEHDYRGLPPGPGRELVFDVCNACHSVVLVAQQRLSRKIWDETLVWMVEEQDMPELEPDEREAVLTYLSTQLSAETPR